MKRLLTVLIGLGTIVAAAFGGMAAAYGLAGWLEGLVKNTFGISGGGGLANMLTLMLVFVMVIATFLTLAERKWSAMMQNRVGPNRARLPIPGLSQRPLAGIPHIVTDVLKMLTKEDFRPSGANQWLFNLGPILAFAPVFALFAVVPAGPTVEVLGETIVMSVANPDFGLLYIFAIASLAVYGTSIAGWASNNKFSLLGGVRASSQMISYEVALGLGLVGMMLAFSTVRLAGPGGMAESQRAYLWYLGNLNGVEIGIPAWGFLLQPLGFLLFFAAAFAETKRAPFDAPEGESEIIGYFVEYSGMKFGLFMISEFAEVVILSGVLAAVFFGGYYLPFGNDWLENLSLMREHRWLYGATLGTVFWIKVVLLCYLQLAIRWTFPRFRYDQIQTLGWKILLPTGLLNVFITGAVVLWDSSLRTLAILGAVEIVALLAVTFTPRRRTETPVPAHAGTHTAHATH